MLVCSLSWPLLKTFFLLLLLLLLLLWAAERDTEKR